MYKKLTSLVLSLVMLGSMVVPAAAYESETAEQPAAEEEAVSVDNVDFVVSQKQLPEISGDGEDEPKVYGDFEYVIDTSVDEITLTKYNGNDTAVVIPDKIDSMPVVKLGSQLFRDYAKLREVTIPSTVTNINYQAFFGCERLETADIPASVECIESEAFYNCKKLKVFNYPKNLKQTGERVLYNCELITSVSVPEGVTTLADSAFEGDNCIVSVELPSTLTKIDIDAFKYSTIKSVELPDSVEEIGERAFEGCEELKEVKFPSALTKISYCSFYKCNKLEKAELPDSVTTIGAWAFQECKKLSSFTYPAKLEEIGEGVFNNCESLTEITVPEGITALPNNLFYKTNYLEKVNLPTTLKKIGENVFRESSIKSIDIPETVTSIGNGAFWGAYNIKTFVFPKDIETVSEHVIAECKNLESVTLPENARTIGYEALRADERLTEIKIPENVETIKARAFSLCKKLESITLPKKWESSEDGVFEGCESLTEITVAEGVKAIPDRAFEKANLVEKFNLPSTLTKIGEGAFRYCDSMKSITIPESVKSIGNEAFKNTGLTEITIPDSVTEISDGMLRENAKLEKINFPKKATYIGYAACYKCVKLTSVELPDTVETIRSYAFEECTRLASFKYPLGLEKAESKIFLNCPELKEITIPEGVKEIPAETFREANYLEKVIMPSTLKKIGTAAFFECNAMTEADIVDSVTTIGSSAYSHCKKLSTVKFPANLVTIENEAFRDCDRLADANLPDSVETIGVNVFADCQNLSSFHYPASLENIGDGWTGGLFYNCESMTTVTVPEGIKVIPKLMFNNCTYLTTVVLPSTVTKVDERAFSNCENLREINLPTTIQTIGDNAFENCPQLTVYCPKYQKRVISFIDSKINVVSNDDQRKDTPKVLDASRSSYSMLSGSRIVVSANYTMKSTVYSNVNDAYIKFYIPNDAEVDTASVYLDGAKISEYELYDNSLIVRVTKRTGRISFTLDTAADCVLRTYAILGYRLGSTDDFDIIDVLNEDYEIITLSAENIVTSKSFDIAGNAPAENEVNVYVNGVLNNTVKANKGGIYDATVTLSSVSENERFVVRTETTGKNGDILTAAKTIRFYSAAPELQSLSMQYNGLSYDLLSGKKHNVTFVLESAHYEAPFRFTIGYKNTDNVEKVFVTSTRNQITKKLEAKYDAALGVYVAQGWFDPSNHDYVPGKIGVEYLEKPDYKPYSLSDLDKAYNGDMLPEILKNAAHEQTVNEEDHKEIVITTQDGDTITYTYTRLNAEQFKKEYEANHNVKSKSDDIKTMVSDYGWQTKTEGGRTFYSTFDENVNSNETIVWSYESGKSYVEMEHIVFGTSSARKLTLMHVSDEDVDVVLASGLNYAATDKEEFIACNGYTINYTKARANILASSESQEIKARKLENLNELRRNAIEMTAVKLVGSYLFLIGGYKFGDLPLLSVVVFIVDISVTGGDNKKPDDTGKQDGTDTSDTPSGGETDDEPDSDGDNGDGDGITDNAVTTSSYSRNSLSFSIDPSGFVYEAVTSNRIAGAKVVAYWIPYDGESETYWEKPDESKSQIWDAEAYSQVNPLITDNAGCYAWDVPEGWWRVTVEKDGYETATTEWLPVPPPQLDVNIALVSKETPKLEKIDTTESSITLTFDKYMDPKTLTTVTLTDINGKEVKYQLDYSKDEADANDVVYAKIFTLNLTDKAGKVTLNVPNTVTSYCGVPVEAFSKELDLSDYTPTDSDNASDIDTDSSKPADTDSASDTELPSSDSDKDTNSDTKTTDTDASTDAATNTDAATDTEKDTDNGTDSDDKSEPIGNLGDIDGDGELTANDALAVLRSSVGLAEIKFELTPIADIDGDNTITANDALEILRFSVGLSTNDKINKPVYPAKG